jgi:hypothetical protein
LNDNGHSSGGIAAFIQDYKSSGCNFEFGEFHILLCSLGDMFHCSMEEHQYKAFMQAFMNRKYTLRCKGTEKLNVRLFPSC